MSAHFSREEMTRTSSTDPLILALQRNRPPEVDANLDRTEACLEGIRAAVGPLRVSSGYRCQALNALQPNASKTSRHMEGLAADVVPLKNSLRALMDAACGTAEVDQAIWEFNRWVHVGLAPAGQAPRRQFLMKFEGSGYEPWNPADPRVRA